MKLVGIAAAALIYGLIGASIFGSAGCPNQNRNDSINHANLGARALGQKQYDVAIIEGKQAVEKWPDNHVGWFNLANAYAGKRDDNNAVEAMSHAVQLQPDQAMYQLAYGKFLYEKAVQTAREDQ